MGLIRDLFRLRKQAKEIREAYPTPSLSELVQHAGQMMDEAPQLLQQLQDAQADSAALLSDGVPGVATLVAIRDTRMTIGTGGAENPVAELELDVEVDGAPPVRVTSRQVVPRLQVGRLVMGGRFHVRVDALDRSKLAIDWDAAPPP